jgi:uncharacterized RDD family membrane protein YckC
MAEPSSTRFQRRFVTPEGVDLRLVLAEAGERLGALLLDLAIMFAVLIGGTIILALSGFAIGKYAPQLLLILWLLGFFVLRNGYFILFEMGPRAATPGKRKMGLRVVARDGGRLTGDAVIARNAMRELEFFLPLSFMAQQFGADGSGWAAFAGLVWTGIFLFFPFFNKDRLRVGDLLAGTWVVHAPRQDLGLDLIDDAEHVAERFRFSDAQLGAYGVYELQTLEEVLRLRDRESMHQVAQSIRLKIGWQGSPDDAEFLGAYYAALRGRLERGLLFGRRRRDKHDPIGAPAEIAARYQFSDMQLDAYGPKQVETLDEVLRMRDPDAMARVSANIRAKIGWLGEPEDAEFLGAYYSALRRRVERRLG